MKCFKMIKASMISASFLGASLCLSQSIETIRKNNTAVDFYKLEEPDLQQSFQNFLEALKEDSKNPVVRNNLGVLNSKEEKLEDSIKNLEMALEHFGGMNPDRWSSYKGKYGSFLPVVLFNLGVAYTSKKDIEKALNAYQMALLFNPESKEIKTNIELLIQSQQGQGQGDGNSEENDKKDSESKDQKDGQPKDDDKKKEDQKNKDQQKKQKQKQEFKSKELTKNDVRKFLEEIKRQEQKIRAKEMQKSNQRQEKDYEKDW